MITHYYNNMDACKCWFGAISLTLMQSLLTAQWIPKGYLVLKEHLIGLEGGTNFLNQSWREVKQNSPRLPSRLSWKLLWLHYADSSPVSMVLRCVSQFFWPVSKHSFTEHGHTYMTIFGKNLIVWNHLTLCNVVDVERYP